MRTMKTATVMNLRSFRRRTGGRSANTCSKVVKVWVKQLTRQRGYTDQMVEDTDAMILTFGSYRLGELIQYLKNTCPAHLYGTSISPPAAQQIISSIKVLLREDGSSRGAQKLARIRENSNFFRSEVQKMGFEVLGDNDSPVMRIMLYNPAKIPAFSRECLKRNVAIVVVGFPATPLLLSRACICISASSSFLSLQV